MSEICPTCKNEFFQPFTCVTCGAEKLYDATLNTALAAADKLQRDLAAANEARATLEMLNDGLKHELTEWKRRADESQRDAERYRWLRSDEANVMEVCITADEIAPGQFEGFTFQSGDELDAAIDTAIQQEKPQ